MQIDGSWALVTGGASGLGLATARRIIERGGGAVLADISEEQGAKAVADLGERARFVRADVTDEAGVAAALDAAQEQGPLRFVVHCAGRGGDRTRIIDKERKPGELETFAEVVRVNLVGTYNVLRLVAASMGANRPGAGGERGVVVMTASVAAFDGQIGQTAYSASKGGVAAMTLPAARDLAAIGVRVCTIAPGVFRTPMLAGLPEAAQRSLEASVPFPARLGEPAEYALLACQIAEHPYLNGEVIRLDAALRMGPK